MRTFVLTALLLVAIAASAWADDVPDPCKLLLESDMSSILGLGSVEIQQAPTAPPVASYRVVDRGAGNIGLAIPVGSGPRKGNNILDSVTKLSYSLAHEHGSRPGNSPRRDSLLL
jgi:hypothetical protein